MKYRTSISLLILLMTLFFVSPLSAQEEKLDEEVVPPKGWYIGVEGGMPFGLATFSSFGHDKAHIGWMGGLYGGYRFSPVLSAELTAKYGQMTLTARDCCVDCDYWIGSDGVRYNAAVMGMDSWNYRDLQSYVDIGQYGARLNVNILGFFNRPQPCRWSVELSPHLYAVSTKASVQTIGNKTDVQKGSTKWHLGYGGNLQAAYQINSRLQLGIYSGVTVLSDSKMDAMPEYLHKSNFIWESGLRLGYHLGIK